jgi:PAS domain S-box-containing protein
MLSMLQGLALIHPLVVAVDSRAHVIWVSDDMRLVHTDTTRLAGRPMSKLVDAMRGEDFAPPRAIDRLLVTAFEEGRATGQLELESARTGDLVSLSLSAFRMSGSQGLDHVVWIAHPTRPPASPDARVELDPSPAEPTNLEAASRLGFVLESTSDGVLILDRRGRVTLANTAAGQLLGCPSEILVGRPFADFVTGSDGASDLAARLVTAGDVLPTEIECPRTEGRTRRLSISSRARALPGRPGSDERETLVFVRDVRERHAALEALARKNEEFETYVRGVSHDLRSPLVALLGFTRLLRDDYQEILPRTALHFIDRIEQAGRNMERLLHDMLELSRIGATRDHRVAVNPRPILQQLASELKLQIDEKDIDLQLPEDTPTIVCDRTRLYQIFSNLIGNAVRHMDAKTGSLIRVEIEDRDDGWQISVHDNGPGIAPANRDRIFEAFHSQGRNAQGHKSCGLGLAIVRKIVELHHGRIWVESELGLGSRFFVWLPRD